MSRREFITLKMFTFKNAWSCDYNRTSSFNMVSFKWINIKLT
jgi:hypothetical protein